VRSRHRKRSSTKMWAVVGCLWGRMLNYNHMNYDINFNAAAFVNVTCNVPVITLRL